MHTMTDGQVLEWIRGDSALNRARQEFSSSCARIEQALQQAKMPTPIEIRRMELEAVIRIAARLGVTV